MIHGTIIRPPVLDVATCKRLLARIGYTFSHRSFGMYVFSNPKHTCMKTVAFTLRELRHVAANGF